MDLKDIDWLMGYNKMIENKLFYILIFISFMYDMKILKLKALKRIKKNDK